LANEELQMMWLIEVLPWQLSGAVSPPPKERSPNIFLITTRKRQLWKRKQHNMQLIAHGDYSSIATYLTKFSHLFRGIFGILRSKHVYQGPTHDGLLLLLLLLPNFSLLSFKWEIFTYPGMQQSTRLGSVVLFVV
jgi:hypothetical protein